MAKARREDEYTGAVRTIPVKLKGVTKEQTDRWMPIAVSVQRFQNRVRHEWRQWHISHGHDKVVRDWMTNYTDWKRTESEIAQKIENVEKDKSLRPRQRSQALKPLKAQKQKHKKAEPKLDVQCWPNDCQREVSKLATKDLPEVNVRALGLALNILVKDMRKHTATTSSYKRWQRTLSDYGEDPAFSRPQPIPLSTDRTHIIGPENPDDDKAIWRIDFRIDRYQVPDKTRGKSHLDVLEIQTRGKDQRAVRRVLRECNSSQMKFCGSYLTVDRGAWYINLCYKERKLELVDVDHERAVVLTPQESHPFLLEHPEDCECSKCQKNIEDWVGARGRLVRWHRDRLCRKRETIGASYRYGGRKGRGRRRAAHVLKNLLERYKKTFSQQIVRQTINKCLQLGCGHVVFMRPNEETEKWIGDDGRRTGLFLVTAGAGNRPDKWPWFLIETQLKHACERIGIKVTVKPFPRKEEQEKAA